jgi:rhamnosyltransferase
MLDNWYSARKNAFHVVRKDYERAFGDGSVSKKWHNFFSLVSSGFRKEELLQHPFDEAFQYSEDAQWVHRREVKIVYVPDAVVEHSHNYTFPEVKKRFFNEGVADTQMGKTPITLMRALRNVAAETLRDYIYLCKHGKVSELYYPLIYRWVQKMSYYRGAKQ